MMLVLCVTVLSWSGCSFALQKHLPDGTWRTSLASSDCSASRTLPWVDISLMTAGIATAGVAEAVHGGAFGNHGRSDASTVTAMVAAAAAMGFLASGDVGFKRARACEQTLAVSVTASR